MSTSGDWAIPVAQRLRYSQIFNSNDTAQRHFLSGIMSATRTHARMHAVTHTHTRDCHGSTCIVVLNIRYLVACLVAPLIWHCFPPPIVCLKPCIHSESNSKPAFK